MKHYVLAYHNHDGKLTIHTVGEPSFTSVEQAKEARNRVNAYEIEVSWKPTEFLIMEVKELP